MSVDRSLLVIPMIPPMFVWAMWAVSTRRQTLALVSIQIVFGAAAAVGAWIA